MTDARFWAKVNKTETCWLWTGATGSGYGHFGRRANGKLTALSAHRASYEAVHGPIPPGHLVRHRCDNRACVRPDHLELGTPRDNADDMVRRGRARNQHTGPLREALEEDE